MASGLTGGLTAQSVTHHKSQKLRNTGVNATGITTIKHHKVANTHLKAHHAKAAKSAANEMTKVHSMGASAGTATAAGTGSALQTGGNSGAVAGNQASVLAQIPVSLIGNVISALGTGSSV